MDYHHIFGAFSITLQFLCLVPYFAGIFKKMVKPHGFTWLLWGTLSGITLAVQLNEGAGAGAWLSASNLILDLAIAVLAFHFGTFTIARSDWAVLITALLAIPLWLLTDNPLWSVLIVCGINLLGCYPTFRKSWSKPQDEFSMTFLLGGVSALLSIVALDNLHVTNFLYPLVIGISNLSLVTMIWYRRLKVNN